MLRTGELYTHGMKSNLIPLANVAATRVRCWDLPSRKTVSLGCKACAWPKACICSALGSASAREPGALPRAAAAVKERLQRRSEDLAVSARRGTPLMRAVGARAPSGPRLGPLCTTAPVQAPCCFLSRVSNLRCGLEAFLPRRPPPPTFHLP